MFALLNTPLKIAGALVALGVGGSAGVGLSKTTESAERKKNLGEAEGDFQFVGGWDESDNPLKLMKLKSEHDSWFVVFMSGKCNTTGGTKSSAGVYGLDSYIKTRDYADGYVKCMEFAS